MIQTWVLFAVLAAAAQTLRFALQKVLAAGTLSPAAATWARFVFAAPAVTLAVVAFAPKDAFTALGSVHFWGWVTLGGVSQILATVCTVTLFSMRAFAIGITFKKTEVILTAIVGLVLLGDALTWAGFAAIAVGFLGVLLLSEAPEGGGMLNRAAGVGLLSGVFFALAAVAFRAATLEVSTGNPVLTGGVTLACAAWIQTVILGVWLWWREPGQIGATLAAWRQVALVGAASVAGSWSWFAAFSLMNAAYVFAVGQVELIFSLLVGWLWFRERLTARELVGMAILTASILVVAFGI